MKIKFNDYIVKEEMAAIRIPNDLEYWKKKGKRGKECIIFTHNDLDGIYSAIAIKEYLKAHGFKIAGFGILDYSEGWKIFNIDKTYINISVDYAEDNPDLDIYIDHHLDDSNADYKKCDFSIKMKSPSCYGLICNVLGIPTNKEIISVITMIDSAKYEEYGVDIKTILNFNLADILKEKNPRLVFAGAFNQLIKRSDYKTLIEVIHNGNLSIFNIFKLFKMLYPLNNIKLKRGTDKDEARAELIGGANVENVEGVVSVPDFVPDSVDRMQKMMMRTSGQYEKPFINSVEEFKDFFWVGGKIKCDGFAVIRNLVYVPCGSWANALRARALIEKVLGKADKKIQFILLDYGSSLQIASYRNIETTSNLPITSNGEPLNDLNVYTKYLADVILKKNFNFNYDKIKAGGHPGIGSLSNIVGKCQKGKFAGIKFMDIMKNWIIGDITGIDWDLNLIWNENVADENRDYPEIQINKKLMMVPTLRTVKL